MRVSRLRVAGATVCAMAMLSSPAAFAQDEERGIDPNQGENLVEVVLPSKAAALRLQLEAESYGVEFNDHYLRSNGDGSVAVSVFGTEEEIDALAAAGYEVGLTIEGPKTWRNAGRGACRPRSGRNPAPPRWPSASPARRRTRTPARRPPRRLLRELRRALPLRRGEVPRVRR